MNYMVNRTWSDRFIPDIENIVVGHLLETAADPFDMHHATDLMMLDAHDMRIAARVRRPGYAGSIPISSPSAHNYPQEPRPSYPRL